MSLPVPRHLEQGAVVEKAKPPPPRCIRTWPEPRQSGHISAVVPGAQPVPPQDSQFSIRDTFSSFSHPLMASAKLMVMLTRTDAPFLGALGLAWRCPPKPPPKKDPKMSPRSMSPMSKPPKPPPNPPAPKLGSTPAWPNWSYLARLSLSDSTS